MVFCRRNINQFKSAGLNSLNISLDTFREKQCRTLNGISNLNKVLRGIRKAIELGVENKNQYCNNSKLE